MPAILFFRSLERVLPPARPFSHQHGVPPGLLQLLNCSEEQEAVACNARTIDQRGGPVAADERVQVERVGTRSGPQPCNSARDGASPVRSPVPTTSRPETSLAYDAAKPGAARTAPVT